MYDDAVREYNISAALNGFPPERLAQMNAAYAKAGWKAYVEAVLEHTLQLSKNKTPPFVIAGYYARLGRKDEAIAWLQKGYEERDFGMTFLAVDYEFDSLRSDPRFVELLRKIGLPE